MLKEFRRFVSRALDANGRNRHGFFTPMRYFDHVDRRVRTYDAVEAHFAARMDAFDRFLDKVEANLEDFDDDVSSSEALRSPSGHFPLLDALIVHTAIREAGPRRIIEIGSGYSTHVMASALARTGQGSILCIDPQPRKSIADLDVRFERRVLLPSDTEFATGLEPNDVLFIDSSHVMTPGSDCDIEFNRLFPHLGSGVLVHVHDIFLPDAYPDHWFPKFFNEQNALVGWILSGYFEVVMAGYYSATRMSNRWHRILKDRTPQNLAAASGSIWLRRT